MEMQWWIWLVFGIALILLLRFRQRGLFPELNQKAPA